MDERLQQQIDFILEADKLKNIIRRNFLTDESRRENTAEHTWHSILLAQIFFEYADKKNELDLLHILKMITVHDLVEIYAGDTFIFDEKGYEDKFDRENDAAKKLFALLPPDQGEIYYRLWLEFENEQTPEAVYAASIDKIMPVMLNTYSNGTSWREAGITAAQVVETLQVVQKGPYKVWELLHQLVGQSLEKGNLK
ncbi:MAG: HD domain-containing protein [Petrimonas sp.]|nr:HD domain-containing protein [Petrimonas sp.]